MNNYESDWEDDIPFIQMELDILDVHQLYESCIFHLDNLHHDDRKHDSYKIQRMQAMKDFLYRMILEYKYQIDD